MKKMFVLMVAALMVFAGWAAAADCDNGEICVNQSVTINVSMIDLNTSSTTVVFSVVTYNFSNAVQGPSVNATSCELYIALNLSGVEMVINQTNSSPQVHDTTHVVFTFLLGNVTVGALDESSKNFPYNVTANCTFTDQTLPINVSNSTDLIVDTTAPAITLTALNHTDVVTANYTTTSSASAIGFNASEAKIFFTVVDTGSNVSNCSVWFSSVNTTYSNSESLDANEEGFSPIVAETSNTTYLTTQDNAVGTAASIAEATHQVIVQCTDYAGNYANSTNWSYVVANGTVPVNVSLDSPADNEGYTTAAPVAFKFTPFNPFIANCTLNISHWNRSFAGNTTTSSATAGLTLANETQSTIWAGVAAVGTYNWSFQCMDLGGHNFLNDSQRAITFSAAGGSSSDDSSTYIPTSISAVCGDVGGQFTNDAHSTWVCGTVEETNVTEPVTPVEPITPTEPVTPPVEPEPVVSLDQALVNAETAITAAEAAGADVTEARTRLQEARDQVAMGEYGLALELANQAKNLADTALAAVTPEPITPPVTEPEPVTPPVEEPEPTAPVEPAPEPAEEPGGFDWTWVLVVIVVLAAIAYYMTRKRY